MAKRANGEGTICKRKDGLWTAAITVGRDEKTGKLIRKYVYGKTKTEVQEKKTTLFEQSKGITFVDADKVTVEQWIKKWLETYARPKVRQNTYESYESVATRHVIPALGKNKLTKLQSNQIQTMINEIIAKHSPRLGQYSFAVLRMALRQALKEHLLLRDPTLAVSPPKKVKKEVRQLTVEEWNKLFTEAKKKSGMHLAILVEWATGMRREEILGLRWCDTNLDKKYLSICNVVIVTKAGPQFSIPKSKSGFRQITIPDFVANELKHHKTKQTAERLAAEEWHNHDLVFCRKNGLPLEPRDFSHRFSEIAKDAGVSSTFHDLRHDHATRLFAEGKHPKDVQDRLGHSSISMTLDTYTHHVPSRQTTIADWLQTTIPSAAKS
ncbi:tyrosine-type recombinase/integrase [Sporomusa malonica]|uniref:Site-specific recombinase XerD n=1 Tax=Sporomusa malonica TaxID=112901 RepID=A0A1W1Z8U9_9FIRM|nr:site-specific integrase [Sporomusa malonica]SMC44742.1 Site-specific recombinase XerD [Sporomusa malonica]